MTTTKSWAFRHPTGADKVTAWSITQERAKYGGAPLGDIYWSTLKPGKRKRMKHVKKGVTSFFAYINNEDAMGGDGGESLTHRLFKEAIAGLAGFKLKLGAYGDHVIVVTHGEVEKEIITPQGSYFADVYLRFTTDSMLGLKWSNELYLEMRHTHAVPPEKQDDLRQVRAPVVEVPIPKLFEYPHPDDDTTDEREEAHVRMIQGILQGTGGFLAGHVISDPSSVEYLELEVARLEQEAQQARKGWAAAKRGGDEARSQFATATNRVDDLTKQKESALVATKELRRQLDAEVGKTQQLSESLKRANETIERQEKNIRAGKWISWLLIALVVILFAWDIHLFSA